MAFGGLGSSLSIAIAPIIYYIFGGQYSQLLLRFGVADIFGVPLIFVGLIS